MPKKQRDHSVYSAVMNQNFSAMWHRYAVRKIAAGELTEAKLAQEAAADAHHFAAYHLARLL